MAVGVRKLSRMMVEAAVGLEEGQRNRIIDRRLHAVGTQMRGELVALRMLDGIEVIDMGAIGTYLRHDHIFDLVETGIVDRRRSLPRLRPARKRLELRPKAGSPAPTDGATR